MQKAEANEIDETTQHNIHLLTMCGYLSGSVTLMSINLIFKY
jgi:hypothetical protein